MRRRAKIFLTIDYEGLLTDSVAISDVVNFDCYESIVSSCQRVIAEFKDTRPEFIRTDKIFYYKKRARSSRMNPSLIQTTTDVFRAIAEHPSGEIPIGVQWTVDKSVSVSKSVPPSLKNLKRDRPQQGFYEEDEIYERKAPTTDDYDSKDEVPEETIPQKKRKIHIQKIVNTMPTIAPSDNNNTGNVKVVEATRFVIPDTPKAVLHEGKEINVNTPEMKKRLLGEAIYQESVSNTQPIPRRPRGAVNLTAAYKWPDDVRCELVMSYGGISERQNLPYSCVREILALVKAYYTTTSEATGVPVGPVREDDAQKKMDEMNQAIQERLEEKQKTRNPISYIQDAKMEIFKTLSTLNLSKARFNELLDWLKSLELREGKQGRFFLSERNRLGAGLQVHYDTDQQAAQKLNEIYRSRSKLVKPNTLHSIDMNSRLIAPTPAPPAPEPPNPKPQYMVLMPSSNQAIPTSLPPHLIPSQNLKLVTQPNVSMINGKTVSKVSSSTSTVTSRSDPDPDYVPEPAKSSTYVNSAKVAEEERLMNLRKRGPSILRRKSGRRKQGLEEREEPVPMQLFKSYNRECDAEGNILPVDEDTIKKEPVSYSDTESEGRNTPGVGPSESGRYETIKGILRNDAVLPQLEDPRNSQSEDQVDSSEETYRIVTIKSEPLDDF